jgi:imidazolonepropionase-like amidohydrolase
MAGLVATPELAEVIQHLFVEPKGDPLLPAGGDDQLGVRPELLVQERRGIPGLVDMHIHMNRPTEGGERDLANGVTTVRNVRGTADHLTLRARVQSGALPGPTIYTAGEYVDRYPDTVPVERIVFEQKADGYDIIKIHDQGFPRARFEALARSARAHGMPLVGHVPRAAGVETAVREGTGRWSTSRT